MKQKHILTLFLIIVFGAATNVYGQTQLFSENFDGTWTIPSTLSPAWSGTTTTNTAWHKNSYTTGWRYTTGGAYSPGGANSTTNSARFHSYGINSGVTSDFITPVLDFSVSSETKTLSFYYINASGTDNLKVYLSTDGGANYGSSLLTVGVSSSWTLKTVDLGTSTSNNVKIKLTGTSDYGNDDIGIDQVLITYPQAGLPGVVTNPNPINSATGVALNGNLTWDFGADTSTYDLWFGPTGSMTKVVDNQAVTTGIYAYSNLSTDTEYRHSPIF